MIKPTKKLTGEAPTIEVSYTVNTILARKQFHTLSAGDYVVMDREVYPDRISKSCVRLVQEINNATNAT